MTREAALGGAFLPPCAATPAVKPRGTIGKQMLVGETRPSCEPRDEVALLRGAEALEEALLPLLLLLEHGRYWWMRVRSNCM